MTNEEGITYQETNPYGSMTAFLEDDGRTVYLYLQSQMNPAYEMQSVWVKNRVEAPEKRTEEELRSGRAPVLTRSELASNPDISPLSEKDLYFIWLEEGNGLALFVNDSLYTFLPPWSGMKGFHGYSRYVKDEALTATAIGDTNHGVIVERIEKARQFWEYRSKPETWIQIRDSRLHFLESKFGTHTKYWSADGGKFPFIGIARFQLKDSSIQIYSTIGMSGQNMPAVEFYHKDYEAYARIELVFAIRSGAGPDSTESWVPHFMGELVKFPWNMQKWLGEGHTIQLGRQDPEALLEFNHLLLFEDSKPSLLPSLMGFNTEKEKPVRFLYMLPITEEEKVWASRNGSLQLKEKFIEKAYGVIHHPDRQSLV
ncbi:MAG: suppressor of fused domain protein [Leptospiraceae bacterium]|nr:suppressor of fused domain protein [Leptospiraceae bacterium]MCP5503229.1 suppressor of fused domain protein [Leptospiraceae bacterium]